MTEPSDTPETDAFHDNWDSYNYPHEAIHFARTLERRLTAAEQRAEQARRDALEMREALVEHNDNASSFFQIANRIATELDTHALGTNFGGFAETTHRMLAKYHEVANKARRSLAAVPQADKTGGE